MKNQNTRWIIRIVLVSVALSTVFMLVSNELMSRAGYIVAFLTLAAFVFVGIIFDAIGVAVTAAREAPFHAMSSHKEQGAKEAIRLIRNAEKVACICTDVVGDISSIVSGGTAAIVVERIAKQYGAQELILTLVISGVVTAMMVGGKAIGKTLAIKRTNSIMLKVGKVISLMPRFGKGR